jgi:hypothetical protein
MDNELSKILQEVKSAQVQMNPGSGEDPVDAGWLLMVKLVQSDFEFTEDELFEALDELGVPEEHQMSWFEDFASYV